MSYITEIKGEEVRKELIEKQDKVLAEIRKIIGNKKFTFSSAYKHHPTIGVGERPFAAVTKKYVYVSCYLQHSNNEDCTEYGAIIKKFPICYPKGFGVFADKVELEDLFITDLEKILNELKFYLWWEKKVRFPQIVREYNESLAACEKFDKMIGKNVNEEEMQKKYNDSFEF